MAEPELRSLAVVADAHLSGDAPGAIDVFLRLVRGMTGRIEGLVLLGDLFEIWVARDHLMTSHQRRVLEGLTRASREGLRLFFVEGNRDYAVQGLRGRPFECVDRALALSVAGRAVWLAHGDLVNREDVRYRLWCAVSRSAPVRFMTRLLPGEWGRRFITRVESRLRNTNLAYRKRFPEEDTEAWIEHHAARGHEVLVVGHFHQERVMERAGAVLWSVPAWLDGGRWLLIDETGARLQDSTWAGPPSEESSDRAGPPG